MTYLLVLGLLVAAAYVVAYVLTSIIVYLADRLGLVNPREWRS